MILTCLFAVLSVGGAVGGWLLFSFHPLWMLAVAPGLFVGLNIVYLLYIYLSSLLLPRKTPDRPSPYCRFMVLLTLDWICALFRVKIRAEGTEKYPDEPCILIGNHRSNFDPIVSSLVFRHRKIAFLSKPSNFKIPIAGNYVRRCCYLPVERDKPLQALRTVNRAAGFVKNAGLDFGIYPEGTRSKTGELLPFKEGAFLAAKRADAPIVIHVAEGTEAIAKNAPWKRTEVRIRVLGVIPKERVRVSSPAELSEEARQIISEALAGSTYAVR